MSRVLTVDSSLENLKKDAKRWLKAIRAGDSHAIHRLAAALTAVDPATASLRDVQLALAHEYGLPGWTALRQALDDVRRSHTERVEIVLRSAGWCADRTAAIRVLQRWPEIRNENLYTAVITGSRDELERLLLADPAAATRKGGPLGWEPLLYLAYARLPGGEEQGLAMARLLLDHGADPNARWTGSWGPPAFTVLTGVIGEGEGNHPPHPQAAALVALLVEHGADPCDLQALYNTSLHRDDPTWLEVLWTHSERLGKVEPWRVVSKDKQIGGTVPVNALDYLLGNAVGFNHLARAQWLLSHGANANGIHAYPQRPLREEALIRGNTSMSDLLVQHGAEANALEGIPAFRAACMALEHDLARALLQQHPEYLNDAWLMLHAAEAARVDVVALLLQLGMDVDIANEVELRALQAAVRADARDVVKLLIAHGANIDRPTKGAGGGALGFAAHFGHRELIAMLVPLSRDVHNLTYLGMTDRLAELFAQDPTLVNAVHEPSGVPPLFWVPEDEEEDERVTTFLLARGADPNFRNKEGLTAQEFSRRARGES